MITTEVTWPSPQGAQVLTIHSGTTIGAGIEGGVDGTIVAADITDSTAAGRAMVTAEDAPAQTALLTAVTGDSGSGGVKGLVPAPSAGDAAAGKVLLASGAWGWPEETYVVALGDNTTAITTGTAKETFRAPYACTLKRVKASLTTASSSGTPTFDINESDSSLLSTKLTIDADEKTSTTAATAAVISDNAIANDAELTFDIDVAGTNAAGPKIYITLQRTA